MRSASQQVEFQHLRTGNLLYYMCLIDWGGRVLSELTSEHAKIAKAIIPEGKQKDGWLVAWWRDEKLKDKGAEPEYLCGYYHSRLIFRFKLISAPKKIAEVRVIREKVGKFIEDYLKEKVFPDVTEASNLGKEAKAFIYPVFELKSDCSLWRFGQTLPYTLQTTCFYTKLRDTGRRLWLLGMIPGLSRIFRSQVQMRISGAKLVTSQMSDEFFVNLVNVVYHEGLYRQSREKGILPGQVHKGLELRLEKFADELMTSFSQSLANTMSASLNTWLLFLTILIIILTVVLAFYR